MKTDRLELRLDPELRRKLDELATISGKSASRTVRKLILAAHREAFREGHFPALPARSNGTRRAEISSIEVTATAEDEAANLTTDELLAQSGLGSTDFATEQASTSQGSAGLLDHRQGAWPR